MGLFGLLNYQDYILRTLIQSNYAKNSLVLLLLCVVTSLVKFHTSILISSLFTWNNWFDLIFPVIVTVIVSTLSNTIFKYAETHRPILEDIVDYFISNYSTENLIRWKRYFLIGIFCYVLIAIALVEIDNYYVLLSVIQSASGIVICDALENKIPIKWYEKIAHRINNWWYRPRVIYPIQESIIEDYIVNPKYQLDDKSDVIPIERYERVAKIPPKPPTPPIMNKKDI